MRERKRATMCTDGLFDRGCGQKTFAKYVNFMVVNEVFLEISAFEFIYPVKHHYHIKFSTY